MHHLSASSKSQRGLTLIEAIAAIGVMAGMMTLVVSMTGNYTEDAKIAVTAQQIRTVGEAARGYINDNQATIAATATATVPAVVTVAQLVAGGYLPAGFTATNNRSQTMCVLVLEPAANNLQGVVITEGGDAVDDVSLRQVSNLIGAAGGSILSTATTTLDGTQGGWNMAIGGYGVRNCASAVIAGGPGAGHNVMSLWNGGNDIATAFLYRDAVSGRPDLNRMNTSIDMGGFRLVNLQAAAPSVACGAGVNTGDLASAADGKLLSCQGGVWKEQGGGSAFWGDPVSQAAAMPACTAANANESRVRFGYAFAPTRRIFTCDGASWVAAGVDHSGNLVANRGQFSRDGAGPCCGDTGTISLAENTSTTGRKASISLHNGGVSEGNIELANGGARRIRMYDNQGQGMGLEATGSVTAQNFTASQADVSGTGFVRPGWAVETWGCSAAGDIAKAAYTVADGWAYNGKTLSCQSGVWKAANWHPSTAVTRIVVAGCTGGTSCTGYATCASSEAITGCSGSADSSTSFTLNISGKSCVISASNYADNWASASAYASCTK